MEVQEIISKLERAGASVVADGENIRLRSDQPMPEHLLAGLRTQKAAVLAYLRENAPASEGQIQFGSSATPVPCQTSKLEYGDAYWRAANDALEAMCTPDYPDGAIPWLEGVHPALYRRLTSELPDRVSRLWNASVPLADFRAALDELVAAHHAALGYFRQSCAGIAGGKRRTTP